MNKFSLIENYDILLKRIKTSCIKAGRNTSEVKLMAVSKGQKIEKVLELYSLGHRFFGENYLEELSAKAEFFKQNNKDIKWSFIGNLQSNKIKHIVNRASEIQTLQSEKHARYIQKYARLFNKIPYPVYIQVKVGIEQNKVGISPSILDKLSQFIKTETPDLELKGIMAIPPRLNFQDESSIKEGRKLYNNLHYLAKNTGDGLLSLGMSEDLELAISLGSNTLRIGRALFGERILTKIKK